MFSGPFLPDSYCNLNCKTCRRNKILPEHILRLEVGRRRDLLTQNIILDAFVRWRLQQVELPLAGLNAMVSLNARKSYLSPRNFDAYVSSECLWQTVTCISVCW